MAIDKNVLNRLYHEIFSGSYETFAQIVDMFSADTPKSLSEMKESYDKGDVKAVVHISHTLKSNGASLGAMKFSEICGQIETDGRGGEITDFAQRHEQLLREFEICCAEIQEEIKTAA